MVAQNTVRTYGVNQVFRFVEVIWLQILNKYRLALSTIVLFTTSIRNYSEAQEAILSTQFHDYVIRPKSILSVNFLCRLLNKYTICYSYYLSWSWKTLVCHPLITLQS